MTDEEIDVVDNQGKIVGKTTRGEAYQKGLLHPAVNIVVFNSKRELYLQRRSRAKDVFPLFWDISTAEHVKRGEIYHTAAIRGLNEELSISGASLTLLRERHIQDNSYQRGNNLIRENELVELYGCLYDGEIEIDRNEVAEGKSFGFEDLKGIDEKMFTPWGLDEVGYICDNWKNILSKLGLKV